MLKAPETKRSKLKCDETLSIIAFKFNLRHYIMAVGCCFAWTTARLRQESMQQEGRDNNSCLSQFLKTQSPALGAVQGAANPRMIIRGSGLLKRT
jgi:hypothetical protein